MNIRKLYFVPLFLILNSCAMESEKDSQGKKKESQGFPCTINNVSIPNASFGSIDSQTTINQYPVRVFKAKPLERMQGAAEVANDISIIDNSIASTLKLKEMLQEIIIPNPKKTLNNSLEHTNSINKSIEWSHDLLAFCDNIIKNCPNDAQKKIYQGYYTEIETLLLSNDYYRQQKPEHVLKKLAALKEIIDIDVPNIMASHEKLQNSKNQEEKKRYGNLYVNNTLCFIKGLHTIVNEEDNSLDLSKFAQRGANLLVFGLFASSYLLPVVTNIISVIVMKQ